MDAMTAAPEFHRLLFENEHVRVLEVRIRPGEFVPVHTHRCPGAVYVVSAGDFVRRDGEGTLMFDSRSASVSQPAPFVQWTGPLPPHSVENIGTTDIVLITTELKS
jgi:mannose-6-phosphate isomerase-like protein (cupin superfamily)